MRSISTIVISQNSETAAGRFLRNMLLKISQNSQEKFCTEVIFKRRIQDRYFPRDFLKLVHLRRRASMQSLCTQYIQKQLHVPFKQIFFFFFFLFEFSFTTIHELQDCRGRGRAFLSLLTTTSTRFTDT